MTTILQYAIGLTPTRYFGCMAPPTLEDAQQKYSLKERPIVWEYHGPFSQWDFSFLHYISQSPEWLNVRGKYGKIFSRMIKDKDFPWKLNHLRDVHKHTSEAFISLLEQTLNRTNALLSNNDLLQEADQNGLFIPISFMCVPERNSDVETLNRTRAAIYLHRQLEGEAWVHSIGSHSDQWAGPVTDLSFTITMRGQDITDKMSGWLSEEIVSLLPGVIDNRVRSRWFPDDETRFFMFYYWKDKPVYAHQFPLK